MVKDDTRTKISSQGFSFGRLLMDTGGDELFEMGLAGNEEVFGDTGEFGGPWPALGLHHAKGMFLDLGDANQLEFVAGSGWGRGSRRRCGFGGGGVKYSGIRECHNVGNIAHG